MFVFLFRLLEVCNMPVLDSEQPGAQCTKRKIGLRNEESTPMRLCSFTYSWGITGSLDCWHTAKCCGRKSSILRLCCSDFSTAAVDPGGGLLDAGVLESPWCELTTLVVLGWLSRTPASWCKWPGGGEHQLVGLIPSCDYWVATVGRSTGSNFNVLIAHSLT